MKTLEFWLCLVLACLSGLAGDFPTARVFFAAVLVIGACAK